MLFAGIDIGTTGCKCTVYNDEGVFMDEAYQEYSINVEEKEHTIDAVIVFESIKKVVSKIAKTSPSIEGICVTSFGEACVYLDEYGNVLAKSNLFTDPNGEKECKDIEDAVGRDYIFNTTGLAPGKMYSVSKIKWFKNKNPELFKKVKHICLFEDYIVYKLSGIRQIDYSLATRTMAFDVHNLLWDKKILAAVGIDESILSNPVPTGTKAGKMLEDIRIELGLIKAPLIVSGCHDQIGAAIGTGVLHNHNAVDGTGTVECITCTYNKKDEVNEEGLNNGGYAIVPYLKDLYVTYAFSYTGGALLKWYRDKLAKCEADKAKAEGKNPYEEFNKGMENNNPSGLLILPYFSGGGTPYMDNNAKGVIAGLTLETTKSQIYKGLMEGATYEMKLNLSKLEESGVVVNKLYATGGGATSKEWLQIKADIFNKPVVSLGNAQSGTLACIMLAGIACNRYKDLNEAVETFVKYEDIYYPRKEVTEKYDILFNEYKKIYPGIYK